MPKPRHRRRPASVTPATETPKPTITATQQCVLDLVRLLNWPSLQAGGARFGPGPDAWHAAVLTLAPVDLLRVLVFAAQTLIQQLPQPVPRLYGPDGGPVG